MHGGLANHLGEAAAVTEVGPVSAMRAARSPAGRILALQRAAGNRAVTTALLQRSVRLLPGASGRSQLAEAESAVSRLDDLAALRQLNADLAGAPLLTDRTGTYEVGIGGAGYGVGGRDLAALFAATERRYAELATALAPAPTAGPHAGDAPVLASTAPPAGVLDAPGSAERLPELPAPHRSERLAAGVPFAYTYDYRLPSVPARLQTDRLPFKLEDLTVKFNFEGTARAPARPSHDREGLSLGGTRPGRGAPTVGYRSATGSQGAEAGFDERRRRSAQAQLREHLVDGLGLTADSLETMNLEAATRASDRSGNVTTNGSLGIGLRLGATGRLDFRVDAGFRLIERSNGEWRVMNLRVEARTPRIRYRRRLSDGTELDGNLTVSLDCRFTPNPGTLVRSLAERLGSQVRRVTGGTVVVQSRAPTSAVVAAAEGGGAEAGALARGAGEAAREGWTAARVGRGVLRGGAGLARGLLRAVPETLAIELIIRFGEMLWESMELEGAILARWGIWLKRTERGISDRLESFCLGFSLGMRSPDDAPGPRSAMVLEGFEAGRRHVDALVAGGMDREQVIANAREVNVAALAFEAVSPDMRRRADELADQTPALTGARDPIYRRASQTRFRAAIEQAGERVSSAP